MQANEKTKFVRLFGNSLIKYHPEKIFELLVELVTNDFIKNASLHQVRLCHDPLGEQRQTVRGQVDA